MEIDSIIAETSNQLVFESELESESDMGLGFEAESGTITVLCAWSSFNASNLLLNLSGNTGTAGCEDEDQPTRLATSVASVIMMIFFCIGISTTFCVMSALVNHQRQQRTKNAIFLFVISLSVNDFINLLSNQTLVILSYLLHGWHTGAFLCEALPELNMLLVTCSMWHQALIAVHRYIVVVHSRWYQGVNKTAYVVVVMVATRVVPLLFTLSLSATGGVDGLANYVPKLLRCVYAQQLKTRTFAMFFVSFLLPCGVVVLCFTLIFAYVHRTGRRLVRSNSSLQPETLQSATGSSSVSGSGPRSGSGSRMATRPFKRSRSFRLASSIARFGGVSMTSIGDEKLLRRELQITKMFGVIFLVMVVGYVPYGTLRNYDSDGRLSPNAYVLVTALYAVASCMNGVIFMMNQSIRSITLSMFGCHAPSAFVNDRPESAALSIQTPNRGRTLQPA